MEDDNLLTPVETPEQIAAEEAAFVKSFNETRNIAEEDPPEPVVEETPAEPVATPVAEETPPEPVATEPSKLFAGLTEEQLQAALARSGTLQTTVDKMAGRIGQLMQSIDALRKTPPTTQVAQQALDVKLEKLSAAFPELANLLREDLQTLQVSTATSAPLAEVAPAGITQEQLDAILAERLNANSETMREQIEMKVLSIQHPDWLTVIKTPQFALWRDNVLGAEVGKQLMQSEDSVFISQKLNDFKAWRAKAEAPPPAPQVQAPPKRTTRLTNAVLPATTTAVPASAPMTEEDGFISGFNNERKRAGRA